MERLNKAIAASGLASRRQADAIISAGRVEVNGEITTDLSTKVDLAKDKVHVDGRPLKSAALVTYILHKPKGVVCSTAAQGKGRLVTDMVPKQPPVNPIGRLDKETSGLILLTNDGALAHRLSHPSFEHAKEYHVVARWQATQGAKPLDWVKKELAKGVKLGDGLAKTDSLSVGLLPDGRLDLRLTIHEGRHHQVRRMCATLGLDVVTLVRTKYSGLSLAGLNPGQFRALTISEVRRLHAA
ncbi:MAG: pseudouridine synthase [bacterium]